ncbi:MAG: hypothetical protein ABW047_16200 [Nitrospiraceae bacterium]
MELFGIILSIPVALIASIAYVILIKWIVGKLPQLTTPLMLGGGALLAVFLIEIILLATIGAAKSRTVVGPAFYGLHLAVFFLGVPALANVLILRDRGRAPTLFAITLCAVFAFILVLMQYGVTEALYGIDGNDGSHSEPHE